MTLEPKLKQDRRLSIVDDMLEAQPPMNVLVASRELVLRLRGPDGLERYDSPYLAGLAAAARFEPKLDVDMLAKSYAALAIAEQDQPRPEAFARDSARLLVNFTRVGEAFQSMQTQTPSDNIARYQMADESFSEEPLQGTRVPLIISSDRMLSQDEAIALDRSVKHDASADAFVRPRASDLAQAEYLFDVFNGQREAFEDPILSQTVERDADIIAASVYLWRNREVFEPPFEKIDIVEVMGNSIAAREAGQVASDETVLQGMSFELELRGEARTYLHALVDPKSAPNLRVLDVAVHADDETIRFFKAVEIGRFDRLDPIDAQMIRNQREDVNNIPAFMVDAYTNMPAAAQVLRDCIRKEGTLASFFPPQPLAGQVLKTEAAETKAAEPILNNSNQSSIADIHASFMMRNGHGL